MPSMCISHTYTMLIFLCHSQSPAAGPLPTRRRANPRCKREAQGQPPPSPSPTTAVSMWPSRPSPDNNPIPSLTHNSESNLIQISSPIPTWRPISKGRGTRYTNMSLRHGAVPFGSGKRGPRVYAAIRSPPVEGPRRGGWVVLPAGSFRREDSGQGRVCRAR